MSPSAAEPVAEVASIRGKAHEVRDLSPRSAEAPFPDLSGDLFEVETEAEVGSSGTLALKVRGVPVVYDASKGILSCGGINAPLAPADGMVRLRLLVDRGSIEVFANEGRVHSMRGMDPPKSTPL